MNRKGVFFDLYGTLVIFSDMDGAWLAWRTALYNQLVEHGLSLSEQEFAPYGDGMASRPVPPLADDGLTLYERKLQALCHDLRLPLSRQSIVTTAAYTVATWQQWIALDPEAPSVLRTLQESRQLALISNFDHPPHARAVLADLGLLPFFEAVVISGDVGVSKPDPRIFSFALNQTGLKPEEVVYVGDSVEDVQGARAAGLCPIRIRRRLLGQPPGENPFADHDQQEAFVGVPAISHLRELVSLLD
ncbi:MAG: HAD family hydrolase [Chloroflexi bacterium]|jgi:HAD superfamily hydrolase (TIGR01549 family)|nr:HAD family hydrolase [Chloroflexota bacterium]